MAAKIVIPSFRGKIKLPTGWAVKGITEVGITGVADSIANAVFNATGKRVCDLPVTPEKLIVAGVEADVRRF